MAGFFRKIKRVSVQAYNSLLQEDCNPITGSCPTYTGNEYPSYEAQVSETSRKFEGLSAWGCFLTQAIIKLRAAFIMGDGAQATLTKEAESKENAQPEMDFIEKFMKSNRMSRTLCGLWAEEAEIEGKALLRLSYNKDKGITVLLFPWTQHRYTIETEEDDYTAITKAAYRGTQSIPASMLAYAKFGGRIAKPNIAPTKVGLLLGKLEAIDKALRDLREMNKLSTSPTPCFECEDEQGANTLYEKLREINWSIGEVLVIGGAKFEIKGPPITSVEFLIQEIVNNIKMVSASTGLPVHYFGFTDLMSNRSTADSLMESIFAATKAEREGWENLITDLFDKAIALHNTHHSYDPLRPGLIRATIPQGSQTKMRQIIDFWMELFDRNAVSLKTVLDMVPGLDQETEMALIKEQQKEDDLNIISQLAESRDSNPGEKRLADKKEGAPNE